MLRAEALRRNGPSGEGGWLRRCIVPDRHGSHQNRIFSAETLLFTEFIRCRGFLPTDIAPSRLVPKVETTSTQSDILRPLSSPLAIAAIRADNERGHNL